MKMKVRKLMNSIHHSRADIERMYIKRQNCGRGLILTYKASTIGLMKYLSLQQFGCHMINKNESISKESSKFTN